MKEDLWRWLKKDMECDDVSVAHSYVLWVGGCVLWVGVAVWVCTVGGCGCVGVYCGWV